MLTMLARTSPATTTATTIIATQEPETTSQTTPLTTTTQDLTTQLPGKIIFPITQLVPLRLYEFCNGKITLCK